MLVSTIKGENNGRYSHLADHTDPTIENTATVDSYTKLNPVSAGYGTARYISVLYG